MKKLTPDPPGNPTDTPIPEPSVIKQSLDSYLPTSRPDADHPDTETIDLEATLLHALDFLRCVAATSYELGDNLTGSQRHLAFSVMHMTEMAKVMVERSLASVEQP